MGGFRNGPSAKSPSIEEAAHRLAQSSGDDEASIADRLGEMLDEGRRAWPGIEVSDAAFVEHVVRIAPAASLGGLDAGDLYLAAGCAALDRRALAAFEQRFIAEVPKAISRLRPTADFIEEVQQLLREKLLVPGEDRKARIVEYSGRGPLGAWVRVAALRTALSLLRRRQAEPSPNTMPDPAAPTPTPEVRALQERYRPHLKAAVQRALESVDEEDRRLLHRHAIEGVTVEQLGTEHGVHGSTISRRLTRVRQEIFDRTRQQLLAEVRLNESEFTSIVRVLRSDLDVSVRRILGARRA